MEALLRGLKGTGKANKKGFYAAALWLHDHHPKTLAANVAAFADFGYFKDLLEILFLLLDGSDARRRVRKEWLSRKCKKTGPLPVQEPFRHIKKTLRARKLILRYNTDPPFQFLRHMISHLFAQRLRSDMEMLKLGKLNRISLAAKWCPSLGSLLDRSTLLCETIAKLVFPREEYAEYEGVEEAHYAYRVRDRLRKEVLVPLRALQLPEVYMGANNWGSLPYNRVASVAMKNYTELFLKHDEERFEGYPEKVKSGKATIAAGALLPHQIIASLELFLKHDEERFEEYLEKVKSGKATIAAGALHHHQIIASLDDENRGGEVAELQWKRMVEDMAKIGTSMI